MKFRGENPAIRLAAKDVDLYRSAKSFHEIPKDLNLDVGKTHRDIQHREPCRKRNSKQVNINLTISCW